MLLVFRYNQRNVWRFLLERPELNINLQNEHGQTALHTAARFNIQEAAVDILRRPDVDTNLQSILGSSPVMVAAKYASKETLSVLIRDTRVRMDVVDSQGRRMEDIVGDSILECDKTLKVDIQFILAVAVGKLMITPRCKDVKRHMKRNHRGSGKQTNLYDIEEVEEVDEGYFTM